MNDITHDIYSYSNRPIEERAHWYSPAAQAYDKARPHYPAVLISYVAHFTQLGPHSKILEVGLRARNSYHSVCRIWMFNCLYRAEFGFLQISQKKLYGISECSDKTIIV